MIDIAFIGKAGVGKSTIAEQLVKNNNYVKMAFATPLKMIAEEIFMRPMDKTDPADRKVLQLLGTEVGRAREQDIWLRHFDIAYSEIDANVVVDDCRFLNEAEYLYEHGFFIVKITGRETIATGENAQHTSETEQDQIVPDVTLDNSGTIEETMDALYQIMEEYLRQTN